MTEGYVTGDIFVTRPPTQTLKAWDPFWDCVSVLFQFQNSDVADDGQELSEWRLFWVAGITLLRVIGHVLGKVDVQSSHLHASSIDAFWNELKSDRTKFPIFWKFIEDERNNILKIYDFGANVVINADGAFIEFKDGSDAFDLYRQAVYWWRYNLIKIESLIAGNEVID